MPNSYLFALSGGWVSAGQYDVLLVAGRAYDINDPVVKMHPNLFSASPTVYDARGNVVEQATSAPGEKRAVKRG